MEISPGPYSAGLGAPRRLFPFYRLQPPVQPPSAHPKPTQFRLPARHTSRLITYNDEDPECGMISIDIRYVTKGGYIGCNVPEPCSPASGVVREPGASLREGVGKFACNRRQSAPTQAGRWVWVFGWVGEGIAFCGGWKEWRLLAKKRIVVRLRMSMILCNWYFGRLKLVRSRFLLFN